jgi:predicted nucleic acid-binding protein
MRWVLLDSSVYISALRRGAEAAALTGHIAGASLWLSSVVLQELYAGAGKGDIGAVERLQRGFERAGRILVPNLEDWVQAGRVLARLASRYGYESIGRTRLTNDALIAMSAARQGITIITANKRDFARLSEFRPFLWEMTAAAGDFSPARGQNG